MNDEEFDQVPQILFNGVTSFERLGSPGVLVPLSPDTRAVLCGDNSFNVIIVAARFGEGRCIVFGQNGYLNLFTTPQENKDHIQFVNNCKQWVSKGSSNEILNLKTIQAMYNVDTKNKILLWDAHDNKDGEFMNDLFEYLLSGGALLCGTTAWGWMQLNPGKQLSDFPFSYFCNCLGIRLTNSIADCPNPVPFQPELIKFKNIQQTIEDLYANPNAKELYSIIGGAIKDIGGELPNVSMESLENMVKNAAQDVIPDKKSPIKDKKCREQSQGLCSILSRLPGIKAPSVNNFPGDFTETPQFETNVICTAESKTREWFCTGHYAAPGTSIEINVLQQKGTTGWSARIGCHSDDIRNCEEFRRWNCVSISKPLNTRRIEMCSAFGGLVFLESPEGGPSSITVNIHRVVLAPSYNLSDPNRAESWEYQRENAQGLWADISGNYIVFNVPSTSVRELDSNKLDRTLQFWDSVVLAHHELVGTKPKRRERVVSDEQASHGYMHAGYPIVTHLDISDPKQKFFIFNIDTLEKEGSWGLFHEIGHNSQKPSWTFEGTGEVTVNIFTLHAMDVVCHLKPWIHEWFGGISEAQKYLANGANFDEWKSKAGVALLIYAQLAREYGWDSYKAVFRKYDELNPTLNSNQEKMDYWIMTFSRHVNHNLIPLFKFWGFPVSQSTIDSLNNLQIPSINDEVIQLATDRYKI